MLSRRSELARERELPAAVCVEVKSALSPTLSRKRERGLSGEP
jgi:hypothetical protein